MTDANKVLDDAKYSGTKEVDENLQIDALRRQGNDGVTWTQERVFE